MKTVFRVATVMLACSFGVIAGETAEPGVWTQDISAAKGVAKEKGLPILLNFTGSDWCGWCKLMDKSVYSQPEWKAYAAQKLMLVTLDFPKDKSIVPEAYVERNAQLQKQFGVRGYPTYVLLDSDGETVIGRLGAGRDKTPASFAKEVDELLQFSAAGIATYLSTLSPEDKATYQAIVDEISRTEQSIAATKAMMDETFEKLQSMNDSVQELKSKATAFREQKKPEAEQPM